MTTPRDAEVERLKRIIENLNDLNDLNGRKGYRAWWNAWLLLMAGGLMGAWMAWWLR